MNQLFTVLIAIRRPLSSSPAFVMDDLAELFGGSVTPFDNGLVVTCNERQLRMAMAVITNNRCLKEKGMLLYCQYRVFTADGQPFFIDQDQTDTQITRWLEGIPSVGEQFLPSGSIVVISELDRSSRQCAPKTTSVVVDALNAHYRPLAWVKLFVKAE